MKSMWHRAMLLISALLISLSAVAGEVLTLADVRNEVLNKNLDVLIQYEKYQQAQRGVGVALGEFLPGASIQFINVNTTLAIAQSVLPTPSGWFDYRESQQLAMAEEYTTEAIKLNILEGLTNNYINIKHHEATLVSMAKEEKLLAADWAEAQAREEMGVGTASETFTARRFLLQHKQQMFLLNMLIAQEKEFLMIGLNRRPTSNFTLAALPAVNEASIPASVEIATSLGLTRAPEIMSNRYQVQAAQYGVTSARWSFISFTGIGFNYPSLLAIEKSQVREIRIQGEKLTLEIENQIASGYEKLAIINERIELQKQVVETTRRIIEEQAQMCAGKQLPSNVCLNAKRNLMAEERGLVTLEMEKRIQLNTIERLVGTNSTTVNTDVKKYDSLTLYKSTKSVGSSKVDLGLFIKGSSSVLGDVESVFYTIENVVSGVRVSNSATSFKYTIRMRIKGDYKVVARVHLKNGHTVTKTGLVTIK